MDKCYILHRGSNQCWFLSNFQRSDGPGRPLFGDRQNSTPRRQGEGTEKINIIITTVTTEYRYYLYFTESYNILQRTFIQGPTKNENDLPKQVYVPPPHRP